MSKIPLTKILTLTVIIVTALLLVVSVSRAENDNEEGDRYEEDYRPAVSAPPTETIVPITNPSVTPQDIIESKTITTSTQIDNSAILASLEDSDQDGITNGVDKYPGQDDFSFYLIDNNNNGIADDLEILIK